LNHAECSLNHAKCSLSHISDQHTCFFCPTDARSCFAYLLTV
jgi:hypothetical protein